jgi:PTS system mannose-specific IID component
MLFFITENMVGAMVPAIAISLEEERALGADITDEAITGVKTGLMGPLAGIGDTLNYATIWPLIQAFFIPWGQQGLWWAALAPGVIGYTLLTQEGLFLWNLGYKLGTRAAVSILQTSAVQRTISFFSVMGLFVLGGLSAGIVDVETAIRIPEGFKQFFTIQTGLLDVILPGMLSLAAIFGIYWYLKRGGSMIKATIALVIIGLVLGSLRILGVPVS